MDSKPLRSFSDTVFIYLILMFLNACAMTQLQAPRIYLDAYSPIKTEGLIASTQLKLRIANPNAVPLPLASMDYQIQLNNHSLLSGTTSELPTIAAGGEELVEISLNINIFAAPQFLLELRNNAKFEYDFISTVNLERSLSSFDIRETGEITAK